MPCRFRLSALLLAVTVVPNALADTYIWPDEDSCDGTLAACIDAAAEGDTILVATDTVDEGVAVFKNLTIENAPGYRPRLAANRVVDAFFTGTEPVDLTLRGLGFERGRVSINEASAGDARIVLENLDFANVDNLAGGSAIHVSSSSGGDLELAVETNRVRIGEDGGNTIGLHVALIDTGSVSARIRYNRFDGFGHRPISAIEWTAAAFPPMTLGHQDVVIAGNVIGGDTPHLSTTDGFGSGIRLYHNADGATAAYLLFNNVVHTRRSGIGGNGVNVAVVRGELDLTAYNNSVLNGIHGISLYEELANGADLDAELVNNLIAYQESFGIDIPDDSEAQGDIVNHHNAVFGNGIDNFTPGIGTITGHPRLRVDRGGFLAADSPLRDTGNTQELRDRLDQAGEPHLDAAGLRRIKLGAVDIGAYEYGDHTLVAHNPTAALTLTLDDPHLNGIGNHMLQISRVANPSGEGLPIENPRPLSQRYDFMQRWRVVADDDQNLPANAGFHVFAPTADALTRYVHLTDPGNIAGAATRLPRPFDGGDFLLLTSTRTGGIGGEGVANPHPLGAWFFNGWAAVNLDAAPMPTGTRIAVYSQPISVNAFAFRIPARRTVPAQAVGEVDHPLLNDTACAQPHLGQNGNGPAAFNSHPAGWRYNRHSARWTIVNHDGEPVPFGTDFFVLVDAAQVAACRYDLLFADDFECDAASLSECSR